MPAEPYTASIRIDAPPERVCEDVTRAQAIVRWMGDDVALDPTHYFEHYAHYRGEIKKPVLTLSSVIGEVASRRSATGLRDVPRQRTPAASRNAIARATPRPDRSSSSKAVATDSSRWGSEACGRE